MKLYWRQALAGLVVGLVLGAAMGRWAHWHHGRGGIEKRHSRMVERFSRELRLSPEQRARLESALKSKRDKMKALQDEAHPRFEEIRNSAREDIRKILAPEQREKFEKIEAKWMARRQKRLEKYRSH